MGQYVRPDKLDASLLPKPFVAGKEAWREVHDFAWRCAFDNIQYAPGVASPHFLYARIEAKATAAMKLVVVRGGQSQTVQLEPGKPQTLNV